MNTLRLFRTLRPVRAFHSAPPCLSGHNKWSKIKQKKGVNDIRKGVVYSKAFKDIVLAVRNGGSADPELNTSLATALKRARASGVPKDNIDNALKKAAGGNDKANNHVTFEVIGPGSVGIIVECLTDNQNRTIKFLANILKDNGGRMAAVMFLFKREGRVKVALEPGEDIESRLEQLVEVALDAEAEDFDSDSEDDGGRTIEFKCPTQSLHKLTSALSAPGVCREVLSSELVYAATEPLEDLDDETAEGLDKLVQAIEDADDTLKVWTTADA